MPPVSGTTPGIEDLPSLAADTRAGFEVARTDPDGAPAGWMVKHPDDFHLSADGRFLEWERRSSRGNRRVVPDARMLDRFVALATGGPEDVLRFARDYGPLVPSVRVDRTLPPIYSFTYPPRLLEIIERHPWKHPNAAAWAEAGLPEPESASWYQLPARRESIDGWRSLATEAGAFLSIAQRLHRDAAQRPEDWATLGMVDPETEVDPAVIRRELTPEEIKAGLPWHAPAANLRRSDLARRFRIWSAGSIRGIEIRWWDTPEPAVGIEGFGLFGALVLRIAAGIARVSRWGVCAEPGCMNAARIHGRTKYGPYCAEHKHRAGAAIKAAWRAKRKQEPGSAG